MSLKLKHKDTLTLGYENRFVKTAYPLMFFNIVEFESVKQKIIERIDEIEKINLRKLTTNDGDTSVMGPTLSHSIFNFFDTGDFEDLRVVLKQACLTYQENVFGEEKPLIQ